MKRRFRLFFGLLFAAVLSLAACTTPAGRAARKDVATLQRETASVDDAVSRAQADNAKIAAAQNRLRAGDAAVRTDAQRIDDKAVILLDSKWQP